MTETPRTDSFGWQMSDETRDEERTFETRVRAQAEYRREQAGWAIFAATILFMAAAFQIIDSLTAFFRSGTYAVGEDRLLVNVDYSAWGWTHLGLGVVAAAAGFGLLRGRMWARIVGVGMAWFSIIVNLAFAPAYPFFAITVVVVDLVIIYAIAVHGGALKDDGL